MQKYAFLIFGAVFGFILSRAGATTYDYYAKLFLFQDLQLLWVIATGAVVGALGVRILKAAKARSWFEAKPISFQGKPYKPSLLPGSVLFGKSCSSRSCPPEPVIVTIAGTLFSLLAPFGKVSVPASVCPMGVVTVTFVAVYGASFGAE